MILVSACLLNHPVRYKGDGNPCSLLLEALAKGHGDQLLPFCPWKCLEGPPLHLCAPKLFPLLISKGHFFFMASFKRHFFEVIFLILCHQKFQPGLSCLPLGSFV